MKRARVAPVELSPDRWVERHARGEIAFDDLFAGMVGTMARHPVDEVVGIMPEALREEFRTHLQRLHAGSRPCDPVALRCILRWQGADRGRAVRKKPRPAPGDEIRYGEPVLCFVEGGFAWFTTRQLDLQRGDGWHKGTRENASPPTSWEEEPEEDGIAPYRLVKIAFDAQVYKTHDEGTAGEANRHRLPWFELEVPEGCESRVCSGTPLGEFKRLVRGAGGHIYTPEDP